MNKLTKILGTLVFGGLVGIGGGCDSGHNRARMKLENPSEVKSNTIYSGDRYWNFASDVKKQCDDFSHLDIREIVDYIKQDLNEGKELYVGKQVRLPEYDCE